MRVTKNRVASISVIVIGILAMIAFSFDYTIAGTDQPSESPDWVDPQTGIVDESKLPETFGVVDAAGVSVGYLRSSDISGPDASRENVEVFDYETHELIGHMIAMAGFTPLGQEPAYHSATTTKISEGRNQITTTVEEWGADGLISSVTTTVNR